MKDFFMNFAFISIYMKPSLLQSFQTVDLIKISIVAKTAYPPVTRVVLEAQIAVLVSIPYAFPVNNPMVIALFVWKT